MAQEQRGWASVPGPLGKYADREGGRLPGPLGNRLWDKQSNVSGQDATPKGAKQTTMPPPTNDQDSKDVHVITWPLYASKSGPALADIKQAPGIANCPVASILAAMASTSRGNALLQSMLSETAATVVTDLSSLPANTLSNPPAGMTVTSSRFFTVKLPGGSVEVSDVLYTDDHDRGYSPLYLRDPNGQAIWASVIEKALAVQLKTYENFDAQDIKANDFWEKITGSKPGGIQITDGTSLDEIIEAAKAATSRPTIGASKPDMKDVKFVTEFHGYAILGMEGGKVKLYDAAKIKTIFLAPADFKHDFQAILWMK